MNTTTRIASLCCLLAVAVGTAAQADSVLREAVNMPVRLAGSDDPVETKVYIVQLDEPAVAEQQAMIAKRMIGARNIAIPRIRFDKESAEVRSYAAHLVEQQDRVLSRAGGDLRKIYSYRYGLNGFAARMSVAQAQKLEHQPEVVNVWEDEIRPMATRRGEPVSADSEWKQSVDARTAPSSPSIFP